MRHAGSLILLLAVVSPACTDLAGLNDLRFDSAPGGTGARGGGGGGTGGSAIGGGGSGGGSEPVFEDDFTTGTFDDTELQNGSVTLAPGASDGLYRSRVFDAGSSVAWTSLAWEPAGPYDKPLPREGVAEQGYAEDNLDMADNVLLFRFDGVEGGLADGTAIVDASASGNDGVVVGTPALTAGIVGQALDDDEATYVYAPIGAASGLQLGTSSFTWALWVQTTQACPPDNPPSGNRVYMGADGLSDEPHVWFGCTSSNGGCAVSDGQGRAGGFFRAVDSLPDGGSYCGGLKAINDGQWHHLAVTKAGHDPAQVSVYVDGAVDMAGPSKTMSFTQPMSFEPGTEFAIAAFENGSYQAAGLFDEASVWRRALSADEVTAVYARGALKLSLRVRACSRADCADDPPFVGPDGDPNTSFRDPPEGTTPPGPQPLPSLEGRYFQYEARMSTLQASQSPKLLSVTITFTPEPT